MPDELIHPDLVEVALDRATGTVFERFVHAFYPSLVGTGFVPLGGMHDGGADAALYLTEVWAEKEPGIFYQASVQKDHRTKIRQTVNRLREFGRNPAAVIFITSYRIPKIDAEERRLSNETSVSVRIRDRAYIAAHVNDSLETRTAFRMHLGPYLDSLKQIGAAQLITQSQHVRSPAVFVFLRQEVERRSGNQNLSEAIVDSLIIWALEGTDPDQNSFKTSTEILSTISEALPFANAIVQKHLSDRLVQLSFKHTPMGREIRHHQKQDLYCLPYQTRLKVQEENAADEALRIRVLNILEGRLADCSEKLDDSRIAAELALRTLQLTFEREGLEFCAFLEAKRSSNDYSAIADHVDAAILERAIPPHMDEIYKAAILEALRSTFYNSAPDERLFLSKLAHTYSLLFSLKAEPRILQYFQEMATDFYLYVGADLIVRALSERYVRPEDQRVRTVLRMLVDAGSTLVLTEPVLEEVVQHLRTTDNEFRNLFSKQESKITYQIARNCPKILIRAYFYTRFDPPEGIEVPPSWTEILRFVSAWYRGGHGRSKAVSTVRLPHEI